MSRPSSSPLSPLPIELVSWVLEFCDKEDLQSLSLVCYELAILSRPVLFRALEIVRASEPGRRSEPLLLSNEPVRRTSIPQAHGVLTRSALGGNPLCTAVRTLCVQLPGQADPPIDHDLLAQIITSTIGLKSILIYGGSVHWPHMRPILRDALSRLFSTAKLSSASFVQIIDFPVAMLPVVASNCKHVRFSDLGLDWDQTYMSATGPLQSPAAAMTLADHREAPGWNLLTRTKLLHMEHAAANVTYPQSSTSLYFQSFLPSSI
ncbi:hypothetical protein DFH06DRAFT_1341436 [Mycena polygramma]|nr:hypothetical protein DFH06DRAFT_1341436 [Mycena polygramma]